MLNPSSVPPLPKVLAPTNNNCRKILAQIRTTNKEGRNTSVPLGITQPWATLMHSQSSKHWKHACELLPQQTLQMSGLSDPLSKLQWWIAWGTGPHLDAPNELKVDQLDDGRCTLGFCLHLRLSPSDVTCCRNAFPTCNGNLFKCLVKSCDVMPCPKCCECFWWAGSPDVDLTSLHSRSRPVTSTSMQASKMECAEKQVQSVVWHAVNAWTACALTKTKLFRVASKHVLSKALPWNLPGTTAMSCDPNLWSLTLINVEISCNDWETLQSSSPTSPMIEEFIKQSSWICITPLRVGPYNALT